jgi:hypothetical protein
MPNVLSAKKPWVIPWLLQCYLTGLPPAAVKAAVVCEPCMVEAAAIEIRSMVSFEERTIVFEVETIPVVAVPGRIVVVCVSGEIGFTDSRGRIVSACVYRSGSDIACINNRRMNIDSWRGYAKTYAGADENLGITFGSDEASGYDGCKDK